jgi:micrococcal nuclease
MYVLALTVMAQVFAYQGATGDPPTQPPIVGTVSRVLDGDTFDMATGGKTVRIRVAHVDCPEYTQEYGRDALGMTERLTLNKQVRVTPDGRPSHDRIVGDVWVVALKKDLGATLVGAGEAWVDTRYGKPPTLLKLETDAKTARLGLWHDKNPTPPWEYRKTHPPTHH